MYLACLQCCCQSASTERVLVRERATYHTMTFKQNATFNHHGWCGCGAFQRLVPCFCFHLVLSLLAVHPALARRRLPRPKAPERHKGAGT